MKFYLSLLLSLLLCSTALAQKDNLQAGGFYIGQAPADSRVFYRGESLPLTADNRFLIGFGRAAKAQQQLKLVDRAGQETSLSLQLQPRSYKIEKLEGINKKKLAPSPEALLRIKQENSLAQAARQTLSTLTGFSEDFIWPLTGRISGVYGSQRILNGEPRSPHYGLDIAAPEGSPIVAPAGGIVRLTHSDMFFAGKTLIIDHGYGLYSSFLHLSKILVEVGEPIEQGETIALVGASGRVTGPHLDWQIRWRGARLDPALWVPEMPRQ